MILFTLGPTGTYRGTNGFSSLKQLSAKETLMSAIVRENIPGDHGQDIAKTFEGIWMSP